MLALTLRSPAASTAARTTSWLARLATTHRMGAFDLARSALARETIARMRGRVDPSSLGSSG